MKTSITQSNSVRETNTLQFLVNKANTLNVRFAHSTWAGIVLSFIF